jgi:hypothetical protein
MVNGCFLKYGIDLFSGTDVFVAGKENFFICKLGHSGPGNSRRGFSGTI